MFKRIDTCAGEFAAKTPYMYSTYEAPTFGDAECESEPTDRRKVVILGGGPNRIGQGIEFDYCCVHACFALRDAGFETIMVNCNPETVSTDYDTSDRLYFEPLTAEDVLEVLHKEMTNGELVGVIVQFGGQTPLNLAQALKSAGIPILGTSPDNIDLAEDREAFAALVERLGLRQPNNGIATSREQAAEIAARVGYPVLMRPSFVLGGRAMEVVETPAGLDAYLRDNAAALSGGPVLIDQYLRDAVEVDVDALADADTVFVAGVLQHIEEAGVHSGDSACSIPPHSLSPAVVAEIERQTALLARALDVRGLMNIQLAVKASGREYETAADQVYLIEVNPRASRTVPFTAKATGIPLAKIAAPGDGRRKPRVVQPEAPRLEARRGQGGSVPLRALPRHRSRPRPRDEVDRRGDGHRQRLRDGLRQGAARRRDGAADGGHGVPVGQGQRQAGYPRRGARSRRDGLRPDRDRRHGALPRWGGDRRRAGSTRSSRAGRTSSTGSRTATLPSSSTRPKASSR